MLPPRSFLAGYVFRGAVLWFAIHLGAGFVSAAGGGEPALLLSALAAAFLLGAVYLASLVDDRVRSDDVFLANLGVAPSSSAAVSVGAALALELGAQLLLRSL